MSAGGADALHAEIRGRSRPLRGPADLDPVVDLARHRRFVAIGEASHGTHEYYEQRAALTRRLVEECGVSWIAVEGDWPDCWRVDRWVRGLAEPEADAARVLSGIRRWPTWLWANAETAAFLDRLRAWNAVRPPEQRTGFVGLDLYSLWDSLARVIGWLDEHRPEALPEAMEAWRCFAPFSEDPQRYAWSTRLVPTSCETDVVDLLVAVRGATAHDGDDAFDAAQNAEIVSRAERYYRAMVRTDRASWNIRDVHMAETVDRLARRTGPAARGVIWAHNTHVGDARATSMADQGLLNLGQLLRQRHDPGQVLLVGIAGHRGEVLAARGWGLPEERMPVPPGRRGDHEALLHDALGGDAVIDLRRGAPGPWSRTRLGMRAIGVVHEPREDGGYVPTVMGARYDALLWVEGTTALRPLHHEPPPVEPELETAPSGV
ncbi:erythromycin esterase family protein [Amnibacterium kyonggiense]|uniref:Erythromycin esterase-like protein n=1 Tax=Amnibacterium kyonggiense TaxID=595671 RepID=A0A4R7FKJ8_9MICO|nr:erythromycin esterase family protein [Amnibacterium kyonggiense]TDS76883.1 erythromycin esterase-like protein [Amnibacterium kyonggiense]